MPGARSPGPGLSEMVRIVATGQGKRILCAIFFQSGECLGKVLTTFTHSWLKLGNYLESTTRKSDGRSESGVLRPDRGSYRGPPQMQLIQKYFSTAEIVKKLANRLID